MINKEGRELASYKTHYALNTNDYNTRKHHHYPRQD